MGELFDQIVDVWGVGTEICKGTVREDYSANGDAWNHFPFDMAKSRAYRWGEDGIAGISYVTSAVPIQTMS